MANTNTRTLLLLWVTTWNTWSILHMQPLHVDSTTPIMWTTCGQKDKVALVQVLVQLSWSSHVFDEQQNQKKKDETQQQCYVWPFWHSKDIPLHWSDHCVSGVHRLFIFIFPFQRKKKEIKLIKIKRNKENERFTHLNVALKDTFSMKMQNWKIFSQKGIKGKV